MKTKPGSRQKKIRYAPLFLAALICLGITGCQTTTLPPVNLDEHGWVVRDGQAVWTVKKNSTELAGELLFATHPTGKSVIQFSKTPFPLVIAQRHPNEWQLEIPAENKIYSGRGNPPGRVAWFHLVIALQSGRATSPWSFQQLDDTRWQLRNVKSGEQIEGFLNP